MKYRSPKKPPVKMRNILVELPEDKMIALVKRAKEADVSAHSLVVRVVSDWLSSGLD